MSDRATERDGEHVTAIKSDETGRWVRIPDGVDGVRAYQLLRAAIPAAPSEERPEPDHERQILAFFLEAREHFQDIYDWDDERAAEGFVDWVRETVEGFLDGKYDGGPHDPRRSDATAHHEGGSDG